MHEALKGLQVWTSPDTIVGIETFDDAGIHRLSKDLAIVQTVDFFTPIVDDPYAFGQVAIANALSDAYAKGARPITALNILCAPTDDLAPEDLHAILQGGADKLREAGVSLLGGHSVTDKELKFGAAVTAVLRPGEEWTNAGARAGDALILSKPLGTGVITSGIKLGKNPKEEWIGGATRSMTRLNRSASEAVRAVGGVHACTDVTGFGLAGHAAQMAEASGVRLRIRAADVPLLPGAKEMVERGSKTRGDRVNREFIQGRYDMAPSIPKEIQTLLFDPQTSGGLLLSVEADRADTIVRVLREAGDESATRIGEVLGPDAGRLIEFI